MRRAYRGVVGGDGYVAPTRLPFEPGSMTWRVNREPVVWLIGGPRALIMQVAHPLVAAGVEQFSNYAHDPSTRGFGTVHFIFKLSFAPDAEESAAEARRINGLHRRVAGVSPEGVPYRALDPDLLLWVWATLVDMSVRAYELCVAALTTVERERFYQEQKLVAAACLIPDGTCPPTWSEFTAYVDAMTAELVPTPTTRALIETVSHPELPTPIGVPLGRGLRFLSSALLPPALRAGMGVEWTVRDQRAWAATIATIRATYRRTPSWLRTYPASYFARRRTPLGIQVPGFARPPAHEG